MNVKTDVSTADRRQALEEFAAGNGQPHVADVPSVAPMAGAPERVFGAQQVAVYRDEARILTKLTALGQAKGDDWFYRFPVKSNGQTTYIEGASIKLANDVARIYGNCDVDVRVFDLRDSWLFYARFTDFETGYSLTRPFQQRKNQSSMKGNADRALDIAFQIGTSKAIRNVVVNALQTFSDHAFDAARNSLVERIGKDLPAWRDRAVQGIGKIPCDLIRVERVIGKAAKDWLAPDVAMVVAMMKAIADGMASVDETFPTGDKPADGDTADRAADQNNLDGFAGQNGQSQSSSTQAGETQPSDPPASGQPASDNQTQGSAASGSPSSEAGTATNEKNTKAGGTRAEDPKPPATEAEYVAYANAWREAIKTPEETAAGKKRWTDEKNLRNKINISGEARDDLKEKLDNHLSQVAASGGKK